MDKVQSFINDVDAVLRLIKHKGRMRSYNKRTDLMVSQWLHTFMLI